MIPRIDIRALTDPAHAEHARMQAEVRRGVTDVGFLIIHNTPIPPERVLEVIAAYRAFFHLPASEKRHVDMACTGSNRGWGAPQSEQVDPSANPDYKEVFDCGHEWPESGLSVYASNLWPDRPEAFAQVLRDYYSEATGFALQLLRAVSAAIGEDAAFFDDKFTRPMALLRGNFYPDRPDWAGDRDFGIAAHTDYGCLTMLATDGEAGLEVETRTGAWVPVSANPGEFIINFGEMLEMWTDGRVRATPHRVQTTPGERVSVPLFFNPQAHTNVAPIGSGRNMRAVDHLQKRFNETYVHLQSGQVA